MALVWQRRTAGVLYEVRSAGTSRRLYTDGVLHSQFNPRRSLTGSVWDLLMLPAFFQPPERTRRVLLLGVGGGTVIRQLQLFVAPRQIVGIELNPVHLQVARRFFGVKRKDATLLRADAVAWVQAYRGEPFDLVIDDLFGQCDGEPSRAVAPDSRWMSELARLTTPTGALVINFPDGAALKACSYFADEQLRSRFPSAFRLSTPQNHNAVGAFLGGEFTAAHLRANLARTPALDPRRKTSPLRFTVRRI